MVLQKMGHVHNTCMFFVVQYRFQLLVYNIDDSTIEGRSYTSPDIHACRNIHWLFNKKYRHQSTKGGMYFGDDDDVKYRHKHHKQYNNNKFNQGRST